MDKKIAWHKAIQGVSLIGAFACAIEGSRLADKLAKEEALSHAKEALLISDIQDELAQNAYLSEQERKIQNQAYLSKLASEQRTTRESLERLFVATSSNSSELRTGNKLTNEQRELINSIHVLKVKGLGKNKILKELWGVNAGDNEAYRKGKAEYEFLLQFLDDNNGTEQEERL
ncbi:MAG: hypothetical protein ACM37W_26945 [Actinomycetota bacterium]